MKNLKEKGKNKIFHLVFGRTLFTLIAVAIQLLFVSLFMLWLREYFVYFYAVSTIITTCLIIRIANNDSNPAYKMAWEYIVLALPLFGAMFYILLKMNPSPRIIKRRLKMLINETKPYLVQDENILSLLKNKNDELYGLAKYVGEYGGFPLYDNTKVEYFPLGEDKFASMLCELEKAKEFIFMEYYIVDEGKMWDSILEILVRKAKEGVEVRFMYDGMCTLNMLPHDYPKKLMDLGIQCKVFSPIRPAISSHQNNRDHRKICVIDGVLAYTGGVNLSDEYINEVNKFGHWKDTAVLIRGNAVKNFTMMFLQNWNIYNSRKELYEKYIRNVDIEAEGYVLPYGDSPFDKENVGELVYMDILNNARDYVHIMTPYLVPDNELMFCMEYAAKRGVDVKIILPHITDNPTEYKIARNIYPRLIERGIKIYEYTPGFVHAKTVVSDDKKAVVGTINMDYRSMYLNMECAVYIQGMSEIHKIENDFQNTLCKCELIDLDNCKRYSFFKKLIGRIMWLISPLM